mmetsp:Transcript_23699/g.59725  ORF Transcript_23699/g.59725 Transcript_23699/m.59725 type:complete len:514 (-) Transcript_23699:226-1767(-)
MRVFAFIFVLFLSFRHATPLPFGSSATTGVALSSVIFSVSDGSRFGHIDITEGSADGCLLFAGTLEGLPEGSHGFHVHEYGDASSTLGSYVGSHFNPTSLPHGYPSSAQHHVGDLGNITVDSSGQAVVSSQVCAAGPSMSGALSVLGRALVIHAGRDKGPAFQPTGDAGSKIGVGVIGVKEEVGGLPYVPAAAVGGTATAEDVSLLCVLKGTEGYANVTGTVELEHVETTLPSLSSRIRITAEVEGLSDGMHGFHIHTYGDISDVHGGAVGGHYNPFSSHHGLPCNGQRHAGDLGNLEADSRGLAQYESTITLLPPPSTASLLASSNQSGDTVTGFTQLIGRACIVHLHPDVGVQPTGAAGTKVAMGVIGIKNPSSPKVSPSSPTDVFECKESPDGVWGTEQGQVCLLGSPSSGFNRSACDYSTSHCCCTSSPSSPIRDSSVSCVLQTRCSTCIDFGNTEDQSSTPSSSSADVESASFVLPHEWSNVVAVVLIIFVAAVALLVMRYVSEQRNE